MCGDGFGGEAKMLCEFCTGGGGAEVIDTVMVVGVAAPAERGAGFDAETAAQLGW